jgi:hypothetical protein
MWPLHGKFSSRRNDDYQRDFGELNKSRTDIRNFLTQRALQSFIFLLSHCRDSATVGWIEVSQYCMSHKREKLIGSQLTMLYSHL